MAIRVEAKKVFAVRGGDALDSAFSPTNPLIAACRGNLLASFDLGWITLFSAFDAVFLFSSITNSLRFLLKQIDDDRLYLFLCNVQHQWIKPFVESVGRIAGEHS